MTGPEVGATALSSPRVLLKEVLLSAGQPVCPLLGRVIGWITIEVKLIGCGLVCGPRPEVNVRCGREWREVLELPIFFGGLFNVEVVREECMWPQGYGPLRGE